MDYTELKNWLIKGFEKNNFSVREMQMPGDNFRLVIAINGIENCEVYKTKDSENIVFASGILSGSRKREKFFSQPKSKRDDFVKLLKNANHIENLDYFEIEDNSKDFRVSMRCEFPIQEISDENVVNSMNKVLDAGEYIQKVWNDYFDELMAE